MKSSLPRGHPAPALDWWLQLGLGFPFSWATFQEPPHDRNTVANFLGFSLGESPDDGVRHTRLPTRLFLSSSLLKVWSSNHSTHPKFPGTCQTARHLQAEADMTRGRALSSNRTCPVENILHGPYPAGLFTLTHLCLCASPSSVCMHGYSAHSLPPAGHLPGVRAWPLPSSAHT